MCHGNQMETFVRKNLDIFGEMLLSKYFLTEIYVLCRDCLDSENCDDSSRYGEIRVRYKQKGRQEGCKKGVLLLV